MKAERIYEKPEVVVDLTEDEDIICASGNGDNDGDSGLEAISF